MLHRKLTGFLLGILVVGLATVAWAGVPDLDDSLATKTSPDGACVFNLPNGAGDPMTIAKMPNGAVVDATITLTLVDGVGDPIPLYPFEDLWLETTGGSFNFCPNGTSASQNTDANGVTRWTNVLLAGGNSPGELVVVMVAGSPLNQTGLDIVFNSADFDGDLVCNVSDLGPFSTDYYNVFNFRSDLFRDSVINVSDLAYFARGYGQDCD